jgi:Uncharacterized protein family UPF0004
MHMGDLKIVVAGCVAQQEGATLLRRVPEVDLVMGPQYANRCGHSVCCSHMCSLPLNLPNQASAPAQGINRVLAVCNLGLSLRWMH